VHRISLSPRLCVWAKKSLTEGPGGMSAAAFEKSKPACGGCPGDGRAGMQGHAYISALSLHVRARER
jgi:hypothetical protein